MVCVREGLLPAGAEEAVGEAEGDVILVGGRCVAAAATLPERLAWRVRFAEVGDFAPGRWAAALAPVLADQDVVLLPASPDGRDLAPRLAAELDRPLLAGAVAVAPRVLVARHGGLVTDEVALLGPVVVTLLPGTRGVEPRPDRSRPAPEPLDLSLEPQIRDAQLLAPDPATMDLSEARRIVAGGAGLRGAEEFALLSKVAQALGASVGGTRVVADTDLIPFERQIGTTGVIVDPDLYLAFGISGAVQHVNGLGTPDAVVAVNLDASCPMMAMADLALVPDAGPLLAELAARLGVAVSGSTKEHAHV
ncbi:MAG: mycofactocin-associated electron transfer flavoprotein alpha subunit [Dermatophilaceae bacterium]